MTAAFASSSWPVPPGTSRNASWLFGREVVLAGMPGTPGVMQWLLRRNCSITPRQLGAFYASLCVVSLLISLFFFVQGAQLILAFAGIELLTVGIALVIFVRHVGDRELLTLVDRSLWIEQQFGSRISRTELAAEWVTVEPAAGQGSLVQIRGRGQTVRVGRHLRPELRSAFARELRLALRRAAAGPQPTEQSETRGFEPGPNITNSSEMK